MKLLCFYVTEEALEQVKQALFQVGAGCYDDFERCSWQCMGLGQYQASQQDLASNKEYKVEMLCHNEKMTEIIGALKQSHPCDDPAYYILNIES